MACSECKDKLSRWITRYKPHINMLIVVLTLGLAIFDLAADWYVFSKYCTYGDPLISFTLGSVLMVSMMLFVIEIKVCKMGMRYFSAQKEQLKHDIEDIDQKNDEKGVRVSEQEPILDPVVIEENKNELIEMTNAHSQSAKAKTADPVVDTDELESMPLTIKSSDNQKDTIPADEQDTQMCEIAELAIPEEAKEEHVIVVEVVNEIEESDIKGLTNTGVIDRAMGLAYHQPGIIISTDEDPDADDYHHEGQRLRRWEETITFLLLALEDFPTVLILFYTMQAGHCELMDHVFRNSFTAYLALLSAFLSAAWKLIMSFRYSFKCSFHDLSGLYSQFGCCMCRVLRPVLAFLLCVFTAYMYLQVEKLRGSQKIHSFSLYCDPETGYYVKSNATSEHLFNFPLI